MTRPDLEATALPPDYTHAGGVVVRAQDSGAVALLVVRSSNGRHWVLPKGHIDPGETPAEAAVREVREEAGVIAEVVAELGMDRYAAPRGAVRALYFLMQFRAETRADEDRELRWLSPDQAAEAVAFPGARALVAEAARRLGGERGAPGR